MYKLIKDPRTNEVCAIELVGMNTSFPLDTANTDYQAYLKWLSEGNTPLPADAFIEVNTSTTADNNTGAA